MNNIEILEDYIDSLRNGKPFNYTNERKAQAVEHLIQENKELKERINKSIEFINDDDTFFNDGESWQNVLHIERILKGE